MPTWWSLQKKKSQKSLKSFRFTHPCTVRVVHTNATGPLPDLTLGVPSPGCLSVFSTISFNKLADTDKCFSECCELLWQINGTWGGGHGNMISSQVRQRLRATWGPTTWDWYLKWGQACGAGLWTCGIWHYFPEGRVRIVLKCRRLGWVSHRIAWCGEKNLHMFGDQTYQKQNSVCVSKKEKHSKWNTRIIFPMINIFPYSG